MTVATRSGTDYDIDPVTLGIQYDTEELCERFRAHCDPRPLACFREVQLEDGKWVVILDVYIDTWKDLVPRHRHTTLPALIAQELGVHEVRFHFIPRPSRPLRPVPS